MKSILRKSFFVLKENLLFIQPILLYFLLVLIASQYMVNKNISIYSKNILTVCMFLFTVVITAGVFYINKRAVTEYNLNDDDEEKAQKTIKIFRTFFEGIGENFFKFLFGTVFFCFIYGFIFWGLTLFCIHYFGYPAIIERLDEFLHLENIEQVKSFVLSFDANELNVIRKWVYTYTVSTLILNFTGILYFAVLISEKKNFLVCLFKTIVFFIKNIFIAAMIIVFMAILYSVINIMTALFMSNSLVLAIFIILAVLYFNYYIILVLCFYNERKKDNSNSRTECIGEDSACG